MGKRCLIISGGDFDSLCKKEEGDFVIACDKGYEYAEKLGLKPDLVIADFDSFDGKVAGDVPVKQYPCEKDDTDTMAAVKHAVDNGFSEVVICCALGGRPDHALANVQSCVFAAERGLKASIVGTDDEMIVLKNRKIVLKRREGFSLSVLGISNKSEGVDILGTKYEVRDGVIENSFPLGVSNEWKADEARISVKNGTLLVIMSRLKR
ncbi:MAG: thiamine diphosphokinase [Lachnospiraceae bacterium]|nr:thiamine diphosphokinase [Lachnospiraceae bacterium]